MKNTAILLYGPSLSSSTRSRFADYYNTEGSTLVLCHQFVTRLLGTCPPKVQVTVSTKPLKVKGERKLFLNLTESCFSVEAWRFANGEKSDDFHGMYPEAKKFLSSLVVNDKVNVDYMPVYVTLKVVAE